MSRKAYPLAILILGITVTGCVNQEGFARRDAGKFIYYSTRVVGRSAPTSNVDIYDIVNSTYGIADGLYLKNHDSKYLDDIAAGPVDPIRWCSNEEYYCIKAQLLIAFPKDIDKSKRKRWEFAGLVCEAASSQYPYFYHEPTKFYRTLISCRNEYGGLTVVTYAPNRGIISYENSYEDDYIHELIGDYGLFAQ